MRILGKVYEIDTDLDDAIENAIQQYNVIKEDDYSVEFKDMEVVQMETCYCVVIVYEYDKPGTTYISSLKKESFYDWQAKEKELIVGA